MGKCISDVWLSGLPLRRPVEHDFAAILAGRTVRRIHRRGKYIAVELDPRAFWLIHLGMSGRIFYFASRLEAPKHTHAVIGFSDSTQVHYRDHRRFGLLAAYEVPRLARIPQIAALGKDPLGKSLTARWVKTLLGKSTQEIKSFLLDQRKIAGLGNIYVCEALYRAHIHPRRRCNTLSMPETEALVRAIRRIIRSAVKNRGTSFSDFMDSDGEAGDNQHFLRVFQLDGKRCRRCRTPIERLVQANRSSFYCPRCQT